MYFLKITHPNKDEFIEQSLECDDAVDLFTYIQKNWSELLDDCWEFIITKIDDKIKEGE